MVLYECKCCNFKTKLKTDYNRHIKTKKHGRNVDMNIFYGKEPKMTPNDPEMTPNDPQMTQNDPQMSQDHNNKDKKLECIYCGKIFSQFCHDY